MFWPAYVEIFTEKNTLRAWRKADIEPRDSEGILSQVNQPKHNSRPGTATSAQSAVSIHSFREIRRRLNDVTSDLDNASATLVADFLQKYQFELAVVEHERDCYKRALATQKSKDKPGQPSLSKDIKELFGDTRLWDDEKMALRNRLMQEAINKKEADALQKQLAKEAKAREKEEREILQAQLHIWLKRTRYSRRLRKGILKAEAKYDTAAAKQLRN